MRINDLTEAKKLDPDLWDELYVGPIKKIAQQAFSTVYPGIRLNVVESDIVYISTAKDPEVMSAYGMKDPGANADEFYLALGCSVSEGIICVKVANATAGKYKGAVAKIIKGIFEYAIKKWGTPVSAQLLIDNDTSGGQWERIAAQLGVEYVDEEPY